jgi:[acyl-carrier-protein] S-malonyltransferase
LGFDLWALVQDNPEDKLNRTEYTQPALLVASVALWRLWRQSGGRLPAIIAGHSLGEYSALTCADVLALGDAAGIVRTRGQLMQAAVPEGAGAMAAIIGLEDGAIEEACEKAAEKDVVSPVNYNAPGQVVIAGSKAAVARATALMTAAGARKVMPLPVRVPSHCALMQPAAAKLAEQLDGIAFSQPAIPVIQNVSAEVCTGTAAIKEALVSQLFSPVLWVDSVRKMVELGVTEVIECGPGKVLSGLNKRIAKSLAVTSIELPDALEKALVE